MDPICSSKDEKKDPRVADLGRHTVRGRVKSPKRAEEGDATVLGRSGRGRGHG